ncbi:MAG TPA: hypothetical protein VFD43_09945 [Planctomycetota bacterium]|nr:hypothetical protein [Planctomycetota bacterium]
MPALDAPSALSRLARPALALAILVAGAGLAGPAAAQVPGEYPHLTLSDALTPEVPGPAGPWDNSHAFEAFTGQSFDARISYAALGQPNTNVLWAILVSAGATPYPKTLIPPPLLTSPPFVLVMPPSPALSLAGIGQMKLLVPAGLSPIDIHLQGLVYDVSNSPALKLSNGLQVDLQPPDMGVSFAFVRNQEAGPEGQLGDAGTIDIDPSRLKTLKPLGPNPPPAPVDTNTPPPGTTVEVENPVGSPYRFLPIVANVPDEPVNPLARPITTIAGAVGGLDATIPVADTSFFPSRGQLLIALGSSNLWASRILPADTPNAEVVLYDGKTRTSFLNCQRLQLGTQADGVVPAHVDGELVLGEFTQATTAGARERTRVGLDADNPDLPHVVIPDFTVVAPEDGEPQTLSLDLYRYERASDGVQGFMTFDRRTGTWRRLPDIEPLSGFGTWDPMICMAPDNRSFVAVLRVTTGQFEWNNDPDQIWAVRLDGRDWPASSSQAWRLSYQTAGPPIQPPDPTVQSRRAIPRSFAIIGPDPENYVLFAGLAYKWKMSQPTPGSGSATNGGFEAEYVREEVLVKDFFECPLVPPGSTKLPPAMPRPLIVSQFGSTGTGFPVTRFDPDVLVSDDKTRLLVVAGRSEAEEDAYVIRNVSITASGTVSKLLVNASGSTSAREIRALQPGGHGQGRKAAFSPAGTRIVFLVKGASGGNHRRDWIDIAQSNGASFGQVEHVYADADGDFKENGAYEFDRVVSGLRFIDENRLVFAMGRNPYDDPLDVEGTEPPAMEWFSYDTTTAVMTHLTQSYALSPPPETPFSNLGQIIPGGFFASPDGGFSYLLRFGGVSAVGDSSLPEGTPVCNVLGVNHSTLGAFPVTGDEFAEAPVGNLTLPAAECRAPVETAAAMRFVGGTGAQAGMIGFTAHLAGGNGSDEVFALNRDAPFVSLQATATGLTGVHVRNLALDPYSGKLAFSRSGTSAVQAANEHPYVVDLDNFLFERDLLPTWSVNGNPVGRVMDGSFHFVAPSAGADEALVFAFGLAAMPKSGVAQTAPPAYYSLAAVSDPLAEPVPVIIPLVDTALLGGDFRFAVLTAGPSQGD